jgi:hypothetical protein
MGILPGPYGVERPHCSESLKWIVQLMEEFGGRKFRLASLNRTEQMEHFGEAPLGSFNRREQQTDEHQPGSLAST